MDKAYALFNAYRSYDPDAARKAREYVPPDDGRSGLSLLAYR